MQHAASGYSSPQVALMPAPGLDTVTGAMFMVERVSVFYRVTPGVRKEICVK